MSLIKIEFQEVSGIYNMDRNDKRKIIVYAIFIFIFIIRLVNITSPPLDYSSWRQVDTDSIARNFVENRFNIFYPQLNYDGPLPNYVQLEFQVTTFIIAIFYKIFGYHAFIARAIVIAFFMLSCYYLYRLVKKASGVNAAFLAVLFYGISPINVIYSRNIMPESALMFFTIGAMYHFKNWIDSNRAFYYILSIVFTALAILTKLPAAMMGIPMIYLCIKKYGFGVFKEYKLYLFALLVLGLPFLYFKWLGTVAEQKFVEGIGSSMILPNFLSAITKKETARYLAEQLSMKVTAIPGIVLLGAGVAVKKREEEYYYYAWLLGGLLHVAFIDAVIHLDYYLVMITPITSIFISLAAAKLFAYKRYQPFLYLTLMVFILNNLVFFREVHKQQSHYQVLGRYVSENTSTEDLIIIDRDSPEIFYTSGRKGWRLYGDLMNISKITDFINQGADYFVVSSPGKSECIEDYMDKNFFKIMLPDGCFIYKLNPR